MPTLLEPASGVRIHQRTVYGRTGGFEQIRVFVSLDRRREAVECHGAEPSWDLWIRRHSKDPQPGWVSVGTTFDRAKMRSFVRYTSGERVPSESERSERSRLARDPPRSPG